MDESRAPFLLSAAKDIEDAASLLSAAHRKLEPLLIATPVQLSGLAKNLAAVAVVVRDGKLTEAGELFTSYVQRVLGSHIGRVGARKHPARLSQAGEKGGKSRSPAKRNAARTNLKFARAMLLLNRSDRIRARENEEAQNAPRDEALAVSLLDHVKAATALLDRLPQDFSNQIFEDSIGHRVQRAIFAQMCANREAYQQVLDALPAFWGPKPRWGRRQERKRRARRLKLRLRKLFGRSSRVWLKLDENSTVIGFRTPQAVDWTEEWLAHRNVVWATHDVASEKWRAIWLR